MDNPLISELQHLIVESLALEDVQPEDIDPDEPLFGEGLGLDSIDALELGLALKTLKSSKAPTNYFTPNILRKSWSRLVVSVVHLDALAFPVAAT